VAGDSLGAEDGYWAGSGPVEFDDAGFGEQGAHGVPGAQRGGAGRGVGEDRAGQAGGWLVVSHNGGAGGLGPKPAAAAFMAAVMAGSQDGSSALVAQLVGSPAAVTISPIRCGPDDVGGRDGVKTRPPHRR
jgi:hypothetical protein